MDIDEVDITVKWSGEEYTVACSADECMSDLKRRLGGMTSFHAANAAECGRKFVPVQLEQIFADVRLVWHLSVLCDH
jgi:hypothetical protein